MSAITPLEFIRFFVEQGKTFEIAFTDSKKEDVWTVDAMYKHPFWTEQRSLAKQFLESVL